MTGLFITGTDTGVGKTRVASAIAHALALRGLRVHARKPVESGASDGPAGRLPLDAMALRDAAGGHEPLGLVCPHPLLAPLSPERAAVLEGVGLRLGALIAAARREVSADGILLVEGAGGFCSPIALGALNADLAQALGLPVLVVAADRLGTINHTLMTVEAVRSRGLALAGVVLSEPAANADPAMDNAGELARWLGRTVLRLPHGGEAGPAAWRDESAALSGIVESLSGAFR